MSGRTQETVDTQKTSDGAGSEAAENATSPTHSRNGVETNETADEQTKVTTEEVEEKEEETSLDSGDPANKLVGALSGPQPDPARSASEEASEKKEPVLPALDLGITVEDVKNAADKPEEFLKTLTSSFRKIQESLYLDLPRLISESVTRQVSLKTVAATFWEENADLIPVSGYVAQVANELWSKDPTMDPSEIFKQAGALTRKALGMAEKAVKIEKEPKKKTSFAKGQSAIHTKFEPHESSQTKQIAELRKFAHNNPVHTY